MLPKAELTIQSPASSFRQQLTGVSVSVGRASDCTIPIKDRYLSRKHAEFASVGSEWVLRDCGSANGTYLNGARLEFDRKGVLRDLQSGTFGSSSQGQYFAIDNRVVETFLEDRARALTMTDQDDDDDYDLEFKEAPKK